MRSLYDAVSFKETLVPAAAKTADTAGSVVDTKGFNSGVLVIDTASIDTTTGDETYIVKVQEGAAANLSDAADISGATVTVTAAGIAKIALNGLGTGSRKRYMRAYLDVAGTTPIWLGVAIFALGNAYNEPVS